MTQSVHFSARIPRPLARSLNDFARAHGISISEAAVRLLDEAVRMERYPGIDFRATPSGRCAHVTGTGLGVWELYWLWTQYKGDRKRLLRDYPSLTANQIEIGVRYAEDHPQEIRNRLRAAHPRNALRQFPFLKRVRV